MDGSCKFNEGGIGDSDVLGSLNQQHLPSYHIVLDFRPREWKQDLLQTERENVISQIASAVLTVRSDLHQSQATEIAANFERYTFENSKDREQYQQTSYLKLLQIQESRKRQMAVAEARRMNSRAREWKQEMIQAERDSFVSEITSALLLSRSDLSSSHATAIATNFEVLTLHKSKDKEEYQQIFQTKLKEIQESIQRKEMAELEMGWLEIAELESRMARDQALLEGLPQPLQPDQLARQLPPVKSQQSPEQMQYPNIAKIYTSAATLRVSDRSVATTRPRELDAISICLGAQALIGD